MSRVDVEAANPGTYRFLSARTLLSLPNLGRCQSLPPGAWTPARDLRHLVFVSHRWEGHANPDPLGSQLDALQRLVRELAQLWKLLADERRGVRSAHRRLERVSSLCRQGTLQAAHLLFRTLSAPWATTASQPAEAGDILDWLGFWYDFSCLPQSPRTAEEEHEFVQALRDVGNLVGAPGVSTLVLRYSGDDYERRGWCYAESMLAQFKLDTSLPIVLRIDRWGEPFSGLDDTIDAALLLWEDSSGRTTAWEALLGAIMPTALTLMMLGHEKTSEFSLTADDTIAIAARLLADVQSRLLRLKEGSRVDLEISLATALMRQRLHCRERGDAALVALLVLTSYVHHKSTGDVAIYREALGRAAEGASLLLTRTRGILTWHDDTSDGA